MPETAIAAQRMTVRRMRFPYADGMKAWWNPARPEFSQVVNAGPWQCAMKMAGSQDGLSELIFPV